MEPTYDVKTSEQLNVFLAGVLKDIRKGIIKAMMPLLLVK